LIDIELDAWLSLCILSLLDAGRNKWRVFSSCSHYRTFSSSHTLHSSSSFNVRWKTMKKTSQTSKWVSSFTSWYMCLSNVISFNWERQDAPFIYNCAMSFPQVHRTQSNRLWTSFALW
jgi:uncharacterized protein YprB with RNaseH-like and TPR domain